MENNEESNDKWGLTTKGASALGTGLVMLPVLEGVAHLGPLGVVLAAGATLVAYRHGDELAAKGKQMIKESVKVPSSRGIGDRLLGRRSTSEEDALGQWSREPDYTAMRQQIVPPRSNAQVLTNVFVEHPENETLRLGMEMKKKQRFDPWINDLFGKGMIVAAVQGSGKSMMCGLIIEQAAKCGVPALVFDHKGEYAGIVDLPFVNGLRAGSDRLRSKTHSFVLTVENADDFVHVVMQERHQALIHLPSYGDDWIGRAEIVAAVCQALMRYSARQREADIPLLPCLVFQDEAQLYIPQDKALLPPEAQSNKDILNGLNNAYFALVSNGRSNGYTMCFATPSLTYVSKAMIKSCQIKVLMRHAEKNDLDMCETIVGGVVTRQEMESMPTGQGVVFGFTQKPVVVKFDRRQSLDVSETPGIDRLRQSRPVQTLRLPEEDLQDIGFKGTRTLPESNVVAYQPAKSPTRFASEDERKIKRALHYWQEGHASVRKLEDVSGWSNGECRRIIKLMREQGLIPQV